jgi:EAL domain-containing protein (putative c-di-GMP-specific phosphodiesterase class I)
MTSTHPSNTSVSVPETSKGHILVVDDHTALRHAYARILSAAGYSVTEAADGNDACKALEKSSFEVILTDIAMPGMNGVQLLRAVRERDLDVPVLLVTANPTIDSAVQAVEYGALRYLLKPVERTDLLEAVDRATKFRRLARLKREAANFLGTDDKLVGERGALEARLTRGLDTLWMAVQPIVDWGSKKVVAYEALVRTQEPTLPHPGALLTAAERLGRVPDVGRAIRRAVGKILVEQPPGTDFFINLHPRDLMDELLYSSDSPLARFAKQIVLEITEREALDDASGVSLCASRLRKLGYRIAIDDLGAGYAGLSYFAQLSPEVVKIDMLLVRDLHKEPIKRKLVGSLITLCNELGMQVVCEGVETVEERDALLELGAEWMQGYLFAKPGRPYPLVGW